MMETSSGFNIQKLETNCSKKLNVFVNKLNQHTNTLKKHATNLKSIAGDLAVKSQQLQKLENIE